MLSLTLPSKVASKKWLKASLATVFARFASRLRWRAKLRDSGISGAGVQNSLAQPNVPEKVCQHVGPLGSALARATSPPPPSLPSPPSPPSPPSSPPSPPRPTPTPPLSPSGAAAVAKGVNLVRTRLAACGVHSSTHGRVVDDAAIAEELCKQGGHIGRTINRLKSRAECSEDSHAQARSSLVTVNVREGAGVQPPPVPAARGWTEQASPAVATTGGSRGGNDGHAEQESGIGGISGNTRAAKHASSGRTGGSDESEGNGVPGVFTRVVRRLAYDLATRFPLAARCLQSPPIARAEFMKDAAGPVMPKEKMFKAQLSIVKCHYHVARMIVLGASFSMWATFGSLGAMQGITIAWVLALFAAVLTPLLPRVHCDTSSWQKNLAICAGKVTSPLRYFILLLIFCPFLSTTAILPLSALFLVFVQLSYWMACFVLAHIGPNAQGEQQVWINFTKETTHGHLQVVRHHCWPHAHMPFVAPISVHLLPCRRCSRLAAGQCPRLHEHKLCNTGRGALVLLGAPSHYFASIARCLGQSAIVHIIQ